jgi:hypothetical protein
MATAVLTNRPSAVHDAIGVDDPFHDPVIIGIGIAFIVVAVLILMFTGLFIWGVQYHAPGWNVHSFPPPIVH